MAKLYELVEEDKHLNDLFLMAIDEETGEIKNSDVLDELEAELKNALTAKSTGIIKIIREQEENINGAKNEIARLEKLKKGRTKALERFKNYIKFNMEQMEVKEIETPLGNLFVKKNPASTDVYDETLIPKEFMREKTTYEPKKDEIKKALKEGTEVPGARLVINTSLTVK